MADQTANRDYKRQQGISRAYKAAAAHLYVGELVALNGSGYADKAGDNASTIFVGVCREEVDNSGGSAGAKDAIVWASGVLEFAFSGTAAQADTGKKVYAVDSQTVALAATTTNDLLVGRIVEVVSSSVVRVAITPDV